ncbi:MAG TPA: CDP-alcohol phosphatidyltransferase family protein [Verrucomicrobiae bacterium]|nr:CDP-alcohol phosphatidyltransferase family protein [Verrucomicrobiae bacterium]
MDPGSTTARRPLTSRNSTWASAAARACLKAGLSPNAISLVSIFFAVAAASFFLVTTTASTRQTSWLLLAAALMVQGRLLCNLLDGMVAIEGGKKTKSGEIYNELPDRLADPIILIGAGYCLGTEPLLGWAAAVLALLTAYVRALGVSAGASQQFCGPMAKPHRMAVITAAAILEGILYWVNPEAGFLGFVYRLTNGNAVSAMTIALAIVCLGCVITVIRRTWRIVSELESK